MAQKFKKIQKDRVEAIQLLRFKVKEMLKHLNVEQTFSVFKNVSKETLNYRKFNFKFRRKAKKIV